MHARRKCSTTSTLERICMALLTLSIAALDQSPLLAADICSMCINVMAHLYIPTDPWCHAANKAWPRLQFYGMPMSCDMTHVPLVALQDGLEVKSKDKEMRRVLNLFQLSAFGISAIVGGGIFVVTGVQAKFNAG